MPAFGPISHADLIRGLRALGFAGPFPGGRHAFMVRGERRVTIPNPHAGVIGVNLLPDSKSYSPIGDHLASSLASTFSCNFLDFVPEYRPSRQLR